MFSRISFDFSSSKSDIKSVASSDSRPSSTLKIDLLSSSFKVLVLTSSGSSRIISAETFESRLDNIKQISCSLNLITRLDASVGLRLDKACFILKPFPSPRAVLIFSKIHSEGVHSPGLLGLEQPNADVKVAGRERELVCGRASRQQT